ncbi:MAG: UvrD-helicase domain-containing protein [Actinobacteria bacterium]|nr:UvrD-helicase domain-containing protein [Actinomycetota bacterium]
MTIVGAPPTTNEQQRAAIEARGAVFVAAGAGTGKTAVLVERFVEAIVDEGLDVQSLLVITYTERAAGELRARIRTRLAERGRPDLALELDGAWVSTIHGFCRRLLGAYPLEARIDPSFRVLDEPQALVLQAEAFTAALERFCAVDDEARWQLLATYGAVGLRQMLVEVYATLRSAGRELVLEAGEPAPLDEPVEALREAATCLLDDGRATEAQREAASAALELLQSSTLPERLLPLDELRPKGPRAATFVEARDATVAAALERLAARDRELLQELLQTFAVAYQEAKDGESALDFEDLQLRARDLLRSDARIRERERLRFRSIMVDEFQDTNRLQTELLDLLLDEDAGELFVVGDEFQSIYGFRHADVTVFRERRDAAGAVLPLTRNYRSRPEVLSAVNELFAAEFGGAFRPLEPADERGSAALRNAFELLVTDKAAAGESGVHWRRSEARHVARRVRELVDAGDATPGEIVLLFAAGTDAEWFEEELRAVGLPTYRAAGRNYFGQQQVSDLLAYLRLLHNRYDDEALLTVLASPFVGVSNDALVLVRAEAQRQPIFRGLERSLPADLAEQDRRLLLAFRQRYERLLQLAGRVPLELLCERILTEHDYDLAILAREDGRRRYANVRKLARLARSYEELRGADLEGFVRFVAGQKAVGAREADAVSEEEGAGAVRLLTIHAAKGLEFKVVVVADAGRSRPPVSDILALSDGRFGFKVAHPATGKRLGTTSYHDVREHREAAERSERLRLYYVAMTRAMERLIVSGSVGPAGDGSEDTPIGWALRRLDLDEQAREDAGGPIEVERGAATVVLRIDRGQPEPPPAVEQSADPAPSVDAGGQLALFEGVGEAIPPPAPQLRALPPVPAPPTHRPTRLSYSAISLFERCSYRYYAERVAGMQPVPWGPGETSAALHPTELGDAVHRLLEQVDLTRPAPPEDLRDLVRAWYPSVTEVELDRVAALVRGYCSSGLARRIADLAGARVERPFAYLLDDVLLNGRLDVLWRDGSRALVVDYKTNLLGERSPAEVVNGEYRTQRLVYALACFRAGCEEVEVVYQFLEAPDDIVAEVFARSELATLEEGLGRAIERIRAGSFRPTPSPFACSGCPALERVCAGPGLLELGGEYEF